MSMSQKNDRDVFYVPTYKIQSSYAKHIYSYYKTRENKIKSEEQ